MSQTHKTVQLFINGIILFKTVHLFLSTVQLYFKPTTCTDKKVNYSTVTDLASYVVYPHLNLCVMLHSTKLIVM